MGGFQSNANILLSIWFLSHFLYVMGIVCPYTSMVETMHMWFEIFHGSLINMKDKLLSNFHDNVLIPHIIFFTTCKWWSTLVFTWFCICGCDIDDLQVGYDDTLQNTICDWIRWNLNALILYEKGGYPKKAFEI